jgi:hypothetical protein
MCRGGEDGAREDKYPEKSITVVHAHETVR